MPSWQEQNLMKSPWNAVGERELGSLVSHLRGRPASPHLLLCLPWLLKHISEGRLKVPIPESGSHLSTGPKEAPDLQMLEHSPDSWCLMASCHLSLFTV